MANNWLRVCWEWLRICWGLTETLFSNLSIVCCGWEGELLRDFGFKAESQQYKRGVEKLSLFVLKSIRKEWLMNYFAETWPRLCK